MHTHHRTWFPYILAGLTLLLALGIFTILSDSQRGLEPPKLLAPTTQEYQTNVQTICADFSLALDLEKTYESLLTLRVPVEYKDAHLALVLLFGQAVQSGNTDISLGLAQIKAQYTWLPEACDITP